MKKMVILAVVFGLLMSANVWAEGFGVGPERFFLNGKEVQKGTAGAINGDVIARQNLGKPESIPLKDAEGRWYVGNSVSETLPSIERYRWWYAWYGSGIVGRRDQLKKGHKHGKK